MNNNSILLIDEENEKSGLDWYMRRLTSLSPFLRKESFDFELSFYRRIYTRVFRDVICPRIASSTGDSTHSFNFMFMGDMLSLRVDFYRVEGINRYEEFVREWINSIPEGRVYALTDDVAMKIVVAIAENDGSLLTGENAPCLVMLADTILRESDHINAEIDDYVNYTPCIAKIGAALLRCITLPPYSVDILSMLRNTWNVFGEVITGATGRSPISIVTITDTVANFLVKNPCITLEGNLKGMEVIVMYAMRWLGRGIDPSLFMQVLSDACVDNPEMIEAGNYQALELACENMEEFSRYGLPPLCYPFNASHVPSYLSRFNGMLRGKSVDFTSTLESYLFAGMIMSRERDFDMDHLGCLRSKYEKHCHHSAVDTGPFSPVMLHGELFRVTTPSGGKLNLLMHTRDRVLEYYNDEETVRELIRNCRQLSRSQRIEAAVMYGGTPEECLQLVRMLYHRLIENFQFDYVRIMEVVTWVYALHYQADTRAELASGDPVQAAQALRRLLCDYYPAYFDLMITEIQKETAWSGVSRVPGGAYAGIRAEGMSLSLGKAKLEKYRQLLVHVLQLRSFLRCLVDEYSRGEVIQSSMREVKVVLPGDNLIDGMPFAPAQNRQYLEITVVDGEGPRFRFHFEELTKAVALRRVVHTIELQIEDGIFTTNADLDEVPDSILQFGGCVDNYHVLNNILEMDDEQAGMVRHAARYLEKNLIPLQVPESPFTRSTVAGLNAATGSIDHTCDTVSLLLIPSKGHEMLYAYLFGDDCNNRYMGDFLSHPDSHFFKVINGDKWCGYVTVLEVDCDRYGSCLLVDVFSVDTSSSLPWLDLYHSFIGYLGHVAYTHGFNRVLIPDERLKISSHHNIAGPVHNYFRDAEKVPSDACVIREPVLSFQSLSADLLVVWER